MIGEEAVAYHEKGFNCAQSVLCACGKYTGLDEKTALAVSGGLGGGVRCSEICGAVTGGVLAAGLCFPYHDEHDLAAKDRIAALTVKLTGRFREQFGALRCEELKTDREHCNAFIAYMAEETEKLIQNNKHTGE